jgi:hypothetical protein
LKPRFGYGLGLVAGLIASPWFVWTELSLYESSWVFLNLVPACSEERVFLTFVKLKILSVALIVIATACASLRLFPARWVLRKSPWSERTWPAFAIGFLAVTVWFVHSVMPYRVPVIVDAAQMELRILHVEKRGLRIHETLVVAERNSRFYVFRNDRRLFQYRFDTRGTQGVLSKIAHDHAGTLVQSPELWNLHTRPAEVLRSWNAEGWYVVLKDSRLFAFTSEYGTAPPPQVTDLFHEIEDVPTGVERSWAAQDVCLGFCYGPVAALGFPYSNEFCFALTGHTTHCR